MHTTFCQSPMADVRLLPGRWRGGWIIKYIFWRCFSNRRTCPLKTWSVILLWNVSARVRKTSCPTSKAKPEIFLGSIIVSNKNVEILFWMVGRHRNSKDHLPFWTLYGENWSTVHVEVISAILDTPHHHGMIKTPLSWWINSFVIHHIAHQLTTPSGRYDMSGHIRISRQTEYVPPWAL